MERKLIVLALCICALLVGCGSTEYQPEAVEKVPEVEEKADEVVLEFLDDLAEYGYTTEQIEDMRELLVNVGIVEIIDPEIGNLSYGMQDIKGFAYDDGDKAVQVRFTIENGAIFLVNIYCPSYDYEGQPTYLDGLEDRRADLYYDVEGGYLKKIDWENRVVVDYE